MNFRDQRLHGTLGRTRSDDLVLEKALIAVQEHQNELLLFLGDVSEETIEGAASVLICRVSTSLARFIQFFRLSRSLFSSAVVSCSCWSSSLSLRAISWKFEEKSSKFRVQAVTSGTKDETSRDIMRCYSGIFSGLTEALCMEILRWRTCWKGSGRRRNCGELRPYEDNLDAQELARPLIHHQPDHVRCRFPARRLPQERRK